MRRRFAPRASEVRRTDAAMVRFRNNARLDPSQVEDFRGRGPMRGLPGGGLTVGGGGLGLIGVVLYLAFAVLSGGGTGLDGPLGNLDGSTVSQAPPGQVLGRGCRTGSDANPRQDCPIVGDADSTPRYSTRAFARGRR